MSDTCPVCHTSSQLTDIRLCPFARDKRLDFVEHVLDVLDESRFGPLRIHQLIFVTADPRPSNGQMYYDVTPDGMFPAMNIDGSRKCFINTVVSGVADEYIKRLSSTAESLAFRESLSPANLARGSPLLSHGSCIRHRPQQHSHSH